MKIKSENNNHNGIDKKAFKESLTPEDIKKILAKLGEPDCIETKNFLIFHTRCHNKQGEGSEKLYYYFNTQLFTCYTGCGVFDIFGLVERVLSQSSNIEYNLNYIINFVYSLSESTGIFEGIERYDSLTDKYKIKSNEKEYIIYDKGLLNNFDDLYSKEWLEEQITVEEMQKFNIKYYLDQECVIIPHYDINGELMGIRRRSFNKQDIKTFGKYTPLFYNNIVYRHPLSLNLYGLYQNKKDILKTGEAFILEGEKSVLKLNSMGINKFGVATCGSALSKYQIELLLKETAPTEIILAYDREYKTLNSKEAQSYLKKLKELVEPYKMYSNFSIIFDVKELIQYKDAPVDNGKEIFQLLYKERIKI